MLTIRKVNEVLFASCSVLDVEPRIWSYETFEGGHLGSSQYYQLIGSRIFDIQIEFE